MTTTANSPVVIVLASGRGERFNAAGGQGAKLKALLAGKPVLERTLDAVRASGLAFHVEDKGHPGMGDSIAAAVRATRDAGGWLILPGDLPLVLPQTMRNVAAALSQGVDAVQPHYLGERGHPVGFAASCGEALAVLDGALGASSVLKAMRTGGHVIDLAVDDIGIVTDIDTPDALAQAEARWQAREGR